MSMLHYTDTADSIYTARYEVGYIIYMIFFTLLFFIQFGILIFALHLYYVLNRLLHLPKSDRVELEDSYTSSNI